MTSSQTSSIPETPREALQRHLDREGRLKQWATMTGLNWLNQSQQRQAANEEAENRWFRKTVSGEEMQVDADDDMGHTILGDITHPAPIIMPQQQPQQNPLMSMLLGAAMTAGGGAVGYYFANQNNTPQPQEQTAPAGFDYETVSVGLGKIEDYLEETK
jgi:hypothetical protein